MATQHRLHVVASAAYHRLDLGNGSTPPDNGDPLASVFHRIKMIGEIAGGICRTHLGHSIVLSDFDLSSSRFGGATRSRPVRNAIRPTPRCRGPVEGRYRRGPRARR